MSPFPPLSKYVSECDFKYDFDSCSGFEMKTQKRTKTDKNGQKRTTTNKNGQKRTKTEKNGQKRVNRTKPVELALTHAFGIHFKRKNYFHK